MSSLEKKKTYFLTIGMVRTISSYILVSISYQKHLHTHTMHWQGQFDLGKMFLQEKKGHSVALPFCLVFPSLKDHPKSAGFLGQWLKKSLPHFINAPNF
jgi:hypothetical protein